MGPSPGAGAGDEDDDEGGEQQAEEPSVRTPCSHSPSHAWEYGWLQIGITCEGGGSVAAAALALMRCAVSPGVQPT